MNIPNRGGVTNITCCDTYDKFSCYISPSHKVDVARANGVWSTRIGYKVRTRGRTLSLWLVLHASAGLDRDTSRADGVVARGDYDACDDFTAVEQMWP